MSADVPRVSVLVPFRDNAAHLGRCIEAILAQDLPKDGYETVLIDNGARDGSRAIAERFVGVRFAGVRIVEEAKPGAYAARNRGIAAARGAILAFTDADCAPDPGWLRHHVETLAAPGVDVVLGARRAGRHSTPLRLMMLYEETKAAVIFGGADLALYYGYTNNMTVRKERLVAMGGFDEVLRGADSVFVRQLVEQAGATALRYCPRAIVTHLEITALRHWYAKHAIYGRSNQRNSRRTITCRPMSLAKRWQTYRAAVREHRLGVVHAAWLLAILTGGGVSHETGRLLGRFGSVGAPS